MYLPALRKSPQGLLIDHNLTETASLANIKTDDELSQVHGNYAAIYLKEIPVQKDPESSSMTVVRVSDAQVMTHVAFPLSTGYVLGGTEYTVDFDTGILFLASSNAGASFNLAYDGNGGMVDWEKIMAEVATMISDAISSSTGSYMVYAETLDATPYYIDIPVGDGLAAKIIAEILVRKDDNSESAIFNLIYVARRNLLVVTIDDSVSDTEFLSPGMAGVSVDSEVHGGINAAIKLIGLPGETLQWVINYRRLTV